MLPTEYLVVQLVRVTNELGAVAIVDKTIVPIIFSPGATLQISDEIQATVTNHTT